jgi:aminodeoxyfutalosine deaminase
VKTQTPPLIQVIDHGAAAILPALVNCHTHLELTNLEGQIRLPCAGFPEWLQQLLPLRERMSPEAQQREFNEGQRQLVAGGTWLYGDISNGSCLLAPEPTELRPVRQTFLEVLGFDRDDLEAALGPDVSQKLRVATTADPATSMAAHACYSTSAAVIRAAKSWCRERSLPFSIHVAEHEQEIEFLRDGTGYCRELLDALGRRVAGWRPPGTSPIQYLEHLGVLDRQTILVHAVHLSTSDWQLVARRQCAVCFCPRSNNYLKVGRPDIEQALHHRVGAALGTDSLASNTDLRLFAETCQVLQDYPEVSPASVLHMATLGGAQALQHAGRLGSIEVAKLAALLAVQLPDGVQPSELIEVVIHQGYKGEWQWASQPQIH